MGLQFKRSGFRFGFPKKEARHIVQKCTVVDTFSKSLMPGAAFPLGERGIEDQLYPTKTFMLSVGTIEGNQIPVSVAQWTR